LSAGAGRKVCCFRRAGCRPYFRKEGPSSAENTFFFNDPYHCGPVCFGTTSTANGGYSPWKTLMMQLRIYRPLSEYRRILSENGVTAIEYGLIAALVSIAIISSITLVGKNLALVFNKIAVAL
jgi:pilus assembly protein Flp/PilA